MKNVISLIEDLKRKIKHHDELYYVHGQPEVSDAEYDRLFSELKTIEAKHPELVTPDSPTQRVAGAPLESLPPFPHRVPLLSLESLFTLEEVEAFHKRILKDLDMSEAEYVVDPKFDGLSLEVIYRNGIFAGAGTRGDGVNGEDVTQNAKTIRTLPLKLEGQDFPEELHLRAEVVMTVKGFEALNKKLIETGEEPFANPRNAASGALRQLDSRITASRPLDIYFYTVLYSKGWNPKTHWEALDALSRWGLRINPIKKICRSAEDIRQFHHDLEKQRDDLDYEIDGIVAKINRLDYQESLGMRARSPRWAFALKFEPRKEITHIDDIVVQVGRQGTLTPVAILKPVDVGGVTVSRASLHNMDILRALDVRVGDEVRVARAGDVIPEVVSVNAQARKKDLAEFQMPHSCPVCGAVVLKEGPFHYCSGGFSCPAQLKWSLIHYASRRAMEIEGLGKETVDLLVEKEMAATAADLYDLTQDQLLTLEGFKEKKADNLLKGIEASKKKPLDRFLYALGIRHVGEEVARLLAESLGSLDKMKEATLDEIQTVKGIGPQIAESFVEWFSQKRNQELLKRLHDKGINPIFEKQEAVVGPLTGSTFIFTGELSQMSRPQAEALVREKGGGVTSSVSKKTSYVVVGEKPGSKKEKAEKLGVKIISEEEFLKMIA